MPKGTKEPKETSLCLGTYSLLQKQQQQQLQKEGDNIYHERVTCLNEEMLDARIGATDKKDAELYVMQNPVKDYKAILSNAKLRGQGGGADAVEYDCLMHTDRRLVVKYFIKSNNSVSPMEWLAGAKHEAMVGWILAEGPEAAALRAPGQPLPLTKLADYQRMRSKTAEYSRLYGYRNIHHIVDYREPPSFPLCIISERADGTLNDLLVAEWSHNTCRMRDMTSPPPMWPSMARQICDGIGYMHKMGVAHNDIKPGNIFFKRINGATTTYLIADFGFCTLVGGEPSRFVAGTPWYSAPERDGRAGQNLMVGDLYSVAITLCVLAFLPGRYSLQDLMSNVQGYAVDRVKYVWELAEHRCHALAVAARMVLAGRQTDIRVDLFGQMWQQQSQRPLERQYATDVMVDNFSSGVIAHEALGIQPYAPLQSLALQPQPLVYHL